MNKNITDKDKIIEKNAILDHKALEKEISDFKEYEIFPAVYNELSFNNTNDKLYLIGSSVKGYLNREDIGLIYDALAKEYKDIEVSDTAYNKLLNSYANDSYPCNLGLLFNHYKENNIDMGNFFKLKDFLELKLNEKKYNEFKEIRSKYLKVLDMLDIEMFDYVDNTENVFIGVIHCLMALYGYGSRFLVVNGGSEVGKSEYVNTIKKLMPNFKNLGSSTPASIRRREKHAFNKQIVYLGDKGLKGQSEQSIQEFEGLYEVFGGLITEKEFKRDIVTGNTVLEFDLKSDGLTCIFSQPYTNLNHYGAGDQYKTRSTFITVSPVKDTLSVALQDEDKINTFYDIHKGYINHILKNPLDLNITDDIKIVLHDVVKGSLRTFKYLLALFKAFCQYLRVSNPDIDNVKTFLNIFKPQLGLSHIELLVYNKLYNNLKPLNPTELDLKISDNGMINSWEDMLTQRKNMKEKSFFTAKQVKTYFKIDFQHNKNLKDVVDLIPDILRNLYDAGYLEMLDVDYKGYNIYYIPYKEDTVKSERNDSSKQTQF